MGFRERREQRRWARELDRELEALAREDRGVDDAIRSLGEHPQTHAPIPLPVHGRRHRSRARKTARAERKERGPVLPGLVIVAMIILGVFLLDPSGAGQRLREVVGLDGALAESVGITTDGEYSFAATQPGSDDPVAWNRCRPIRYVVNPEGAPEDWERLVEESVERVSTASGFVFEDEGTTDDRDFTGRINGFGRPSPVLIGWASPEEVPQLAGEVAGLGGSTYVEQSGKRRYITGSVTLDVGLYDELDARRGGEDTMRAILMHELAHVLGLGHVDDRSELMYEDSVGQDDFGPGDLEGLARLGAVGCG
ncbi:matrixin family metalloprotease [Nocardioides sp. zg-DK7169]|uniref:matrixin family metalloprotease n=1 Tax=Nocardioides sp. zg-DK7169 TaxID=2736600 RepID=UPI001551B3B7|nr:matrixin family metalloprotease [Nocardioides sp. zg-DK7169]NPC97465.1 matrixin family metalloprotease [Nocardioides sp. zg-DK7169]